MKRNTPLITLLTGAALGAILLVASMLATPQAPALSTAVSGCEAEACAARGSGP
jgi:hypothetical protein